MCIILNSLFLDCFNDESCKNVYYYSRHFVKNVGEIFELKMSLYYEIVIDLLLKSFLIHSLVKFNTMNI